MTAKIARFMAVAAAVALLGACGGGGDSTATTSSTASGTTESTGNTTGTTPAAAPSVADKYAGTWAACFPEGTGSSRETVTLTKTSDTSAGFTFAGSGFASTNCSGTATNSESASGNIVWAGTKTIGADTVDKGIVTEGTPPQTEKQVFLVRGTAPVTLVTGRIAEDGGTVDADGYPNALDTRVLIKQ
jgi:hypothetical protein